MTTPLNNMHYLFINIDSNVSAFSVVQHLKQGIPVLVVNFTESRIPWEMGLWECRLGNYHAFVYWVGKTHPPCVSTAPCLGCWTLYMEKGSWAAGCFHLSPSLTRDTMETVASSSSCLAYPTRMNLNYETEQALSPWSCLCQRILLPATGKEIKTQRPCLSFCFVKILVSTEDAIIT